MALALYQKDIRIIGDFAAALDCPTPLFDASRAFYAAALAQGRADEDPAAVCAVLAQMAAATEADTPPRSVRRR
jgi:putative dehydrogenase